jgi:hypothetical protein
MSNPAAVTRKDYCPPQPTCTSPRLGDPNTAQEDGLEDRFVAIARLFAEARKCIVRLGLDKVPDVKAMQREYHLIAHEIDLMPLADKVDACRFTYLCDRVCELSNNSLGSFNRQATVYGSGELEQIYAKLLKIYDEVLSDVSRNSPVDLIETAPLSVASTPLSEFGAVIREQGNFLGLWVEDKGICKQLEEHLSTRFFDLLNNRIREKFNEKVEKIKGLSDKISSCFICYNTGEPEVKAWLRKVLVPDLWRIGVKPIWSGDNLYIGADIHQFEKRAKSADFAIVICTPKLHEKYTKDKTKGDPANYSGVTREIDHMIERSKDTTIPVLFKSDPGKATNHVNPFQGPEKEPFAVFAPLDNYAGILKLFAALKSEGKDSCRTIAEIYIQELKSHGAYHLGCYLDLQIKDPALRSLSRGTSEMKKQDADSSEKHRQFFEGHFCSRLNDERRHPRLQNMCTVQDKNVKSRTFNCTLFTSDLPFVKFFYEHFCQSRRPFDQDRPLMMPPRLSQLLYGKLQVAKIYYELGSFEDAIPLYQEILTLKHDNNTAHCNLGRIYHIKGELTKAEDRFVNAIRLSEANSCAYVEFGNFLMCQERYREAIDCLIKIPVGDSSILTYTYVDFPALYEELNEIIKVQGILNIRADLFAHFLLAKAYFKLNQKGEAEKACVVVKSLSALTNMDLDKTLLAVLERDLKN